MTIAVELDGWVRRDRFTATLGASEADEMARTEEYAIDVLAGEDRTIHVTVRNAARSPVSLAGAVVHFRVKGDTEDAADLLAYDSGTPTEITITAAAGGCFEIYLADTDTLTTLGVGEYVWDSWVVLASGKRHAVIPPSRLRIGKPVTAL